MTYSGSTARFATCFECESDRTVAVLSNTYRCREKMRSLLLTVGKGVLDNSKMFAGKRVLLKPNWVLHDRRATDALCMRTHSSFIVSMLELVLEHRPSLVTIGDAPIQGADWNSIVGADLLGEVQWLSAHHNVPVRVVDFRRRTFNPRTNQLSSEIQPLSRYVLLDLKQDSQLEPVSTTRGNFRVNNYDYKQLAASHHLGRHMYCITEELFNADIVISMPKVKTHQKTGLTAALKNLVGLNGDKDYLPHHRVGGTGFGGDCYPGRNVLRLFAERILDQANCSQGRAHFKLLYYGAALVWKITRPGPLHNLSAAWYGNDTCWRMVMDLNRIATHGRNDGTITSVPQREVFSLCDGIIGGDGNGPLNPTPFPLGVVAFANNSYLADVCFGGLMKLPIDKVPLLQAAKANLCDKRYQVYLDGKVSDMQSLERISLAAQLPPGWVKHIRDR